MARTPIVFFSHSSDDNARAQALVAAIEAGGRLKTTFDARDLKPGSPWERQLYRWIARCDAGFVLLTKAALDRHGWVLKEATLLRAREVYGLGSFPLFVLVDDDAVPSHPEWQRSFAPLSLRELQGLPKGAPAAQVAAIVEAECAAIVQARADDYVSRLHAFVSDALQPFLPYAGLVADLESRLGDDDLHWRTLTGMPQALATALVMRLGESSETSTAIGSFGGLDDLMQTFDGVGQREQRANLLRALRPYWVHMQVALELAAASRLPEGARLCVLRSSIEQDALERTIERWFLPLRAKPRLLRVAAGNESRAELRAQVLASWNQGSRSSPAADLAQVRAQMAALNVGFAVLLPPLRTPELARELAAELPRALVCVSLPTDAELDPALWAGFQILEPTRLPQQESDLRLQYERAEDYL